MSINDNLEDLDDLDEGLPNTNIKGNILNLIRTTQRNYINLTNIADNKANILISINALMLTILIPIILSNYEIILALHLYFSIGLFAFTCLLTIIFSIKVLIPFSNQKQKKRLMEKKITRSPFFFTSYADLSQEEYVKLFQETIADKEIINQVIMADLYYFGLNLSTKYKLVKTAYLIFNLGIILTFISFFLSLIL